MKIQIMLLLLPLTLSASDLRTTVNEYAASLAANDPVRVSWEKGYPTPMRNHLMEPTATQVVATTNIVARSARLIAMEQEWLDILSSNNVPATAKYEQIAAALDTKLDTAIGNNNIAAAFRLCQGGIKLAALSTLIVNEGGDLNSITAQTVSTNITSQTVITQRRWQALGLQVPPTNKELE